MVTNKESESVGERFAVHEYVKYPLEHWDPYPTVSHRYRDRGIHLYTN